VPRAHIHLTASIHPVLCDLKLLSPPPLCCPSMQKLTVVDMADITMVPSALATLSHLTFLELLDTISDSVKDIPLALSALTGLATLHVHGFGGHFERLPLGLQTLSMADFGDRPDVPAELSALTKLTHLAMSDNEKEDLSNLEALVALRHLTLSSCSRVDFGSLPALTGLHRLELDDCDLEGVPRAVSALTNLTHLHILGEATRSGWDHLRPLCALQQLWVQIEAAAPLPLQLSALSALTTLSVSIDGDGDGGEVARSSSLQVLQSLPALRLWLNGELLLPCLPSPSDFE
jgi:Leucine-rich repeat (LRR) protein